MVTVGPEHSFVPSPFAVGVIGACMALWIPFQAQAQFDPGKLSREPDAVAARFPDPDVRYPTPGLRADRRDFASHAEVMVYLDDLARGAKGRMRVQQVGHSQQGLPLPLVALSAHAQFDARLPTVLVVAQQHGNEPASGEAALALAHSLLNGEARLLERLNVLIMPRANADGAERFVRATRSGVDVNRDHVLLRTPEARAIAEVVARHQPQLVIDLHEFTVAGRWVDKFQAMQKYDALVQAASVGNLDEGLASAQKVYVDALKARWASQGLSSFVYHTTSPDAADKRVSMGGVQADTGRNTSGLRPALSLLIEVRGVGLGRAHLLRRVHTSVLGSLAAMELAAAQGPRLIALVRDAQQRTAALACRGELVIAARHGQARQRLEFLDATTGADKTIEVDWRTADSPEVQRERARPCGYLISDDQTEALDRLRRLGARMHRVEQAARWRVERYAVIQEAAGARQDARGSIDDGEGGAIRVLELRTQPTHDVVAPGMVYVPLNQGLGGLIAAALEPDSQSSYAANKLLDLDTPGRHAPALRRVMQQPDKRWLSAF
jgi:Zinc carboxypeptidase